MDDPTKDTIPRSAVEYCLRKETVSTNPEKYKTHEKFVDYMNDPNISEFGHWMHSNGFNCALVSIAVDLDKIPSVTPSAQPDHIGEVTEMVGDTILRAKAIDAVRKAKDKSEAHRRLVQLPPAQPSVSKEEMVGDTISRQAAIKAICEDGTMLERQGKYTMTMAERKQKDADILDTLPPAQPTLYGYDIKHLAFVASIMAKEGLSPEEAVTTFRDVNRVIEMMLEDMKEMQENALKQALKKPWEGGQE